jgi:two-component system, LuxR family, sensor kinase FixL
MSQSILQNLETYKDLCDSAHDLIHIVKPDGTIAYVNTPWLENLKYPSAEIHGSSIYAIVQPVDRDRFRDYREKVLRGDDDGREIIVGLLKKDGDVMVVEGFISAKIVNGQAQYTRGIFRDVTRRLQNEAQLSALHQRIQESERNLQQLFFYAPDAIIVIDANSVVRHWNPKATAIFGWRYEEAIGMSLAGLIIPPQHRESHHAGMQRYLSTGTAKVLNKTIEITSLDKHGREFYVALTISSTTFNGEVAFIAFIRDIDEQKRNARDLEQKKRELEVSNQELEQFAHVASHDMKEPIRKILIFTERLKSEIADVASENSQRFMEKIESSATRLANMVDGVLRNSSVKAEQLVTSSVDLNLVIKDIESDLELVIAAKNAVIRNSGLPTLTGSPVLLYQLFYNLIINSLKFSRPGVDVEIDLTSKKIAGSALPVPGPPGVFFFEITLKDNGIGFSQHHADAIFKAFTRLHTKDKFEGTGIGLSLCKNIVEKHHGFIQAFGENGRGATFKVFLPSHA